MGQNQSSLQSSAPSSPPSLREIATKINNGAISNIIVLCGSGISVSAGAPDFRTPGSGLYDNLHKYNVPTPESIFTLSYFRDHPQAFYTLAKEMFPGRYRPSETHHFIKFLADKKILLRCYTQNIDGLEELAGVPSNLMVHAHGDFKSAQCIDCHKEQDAELMKAACLSSTVMYCGSCRGLVKPDIVFFGESLSMDFFYCVQKDFPRCDLLIVLGTSLSVQPFASLIKQVYPQVPRLLINQELCGMEIDGRDEGGFLFGRERNERDIFMQTNCDDGVREFKLLILL